MKERTVGSVFLFGPPDHVKTARGTNARICEVRVNELFECARGILTETTASGAGAFPGASHGLVQPSKAFGKLRGPVYTSTSMF